VAKEAIKPPIAIGRAGEAALAIFIFLKPMPDVEKYPLNFNMKLLAMVEEAILLLKWLLMKKLRTIGKPTLIKSILGILSSILSSDK